MQFSRILVPIDFSDASLEAFEVVKSRFASADKTLVLLHVVEPDNSLVDFQQSIQASEVEARRHRLQSMGNAHRGDWQEVVTIIEAGKPAECILNAARYEGVDLVVMGSHGKGGLKQALFGSTTYDVARKLKSSVMIVKQAE